MAEQITFPNDPPQDGDTFVVGNTTYAWDPSPGLWRAFVTATSSSGGGGGGGFVWPINETPTEVLLFNGGTNTLTGTGDGQFFIARSVIASAAVGDSYRPVTLTNTSTTSWNVDITGGRVQSGISIPTVTYGFLADGDTLEWPQSGYIVTVDYWDVASAGGSTAVNIGGGGGGGGISDESFFFFENTAGAGTYTIPLTGTYRIIIVGSGGTGYVSDTGGTFGAGIGAGGGAGMCYVHAAPLTQGDVVNFTIGAGNTNSGQDSPGSPGEDTTLTVGSLSLTGGGGGGGAFGTGVGGTGGVATGGDFRFDGRDGATGTEGATGGDAGSDFAVLDTAMGGAGLRSTLFTGFAFGHGRGGNSINRGTSSSINGAVLISGGQNFTN